MTLKQAKSLRPGDRVFWSDPDDGLCSRTYVIDKIEVFEEGVIIEEKDGSVLECLPSELFFERDER